ncbi:MAG: hypothetical protein A2W18_04740 [Candidatus Muproteobacteria bacterium RBG_16_60_9]|uniref:DUF4034 domain-containing protein n=1 Tax=Candidatus Muproteobacteria bacterium RBG_16_60_9 TaxID=1817755 RepID=A0A1F6VH66_9PROT|nr:MAG: hypothetical protein A2W18_04740 [Candidatus Muproteobacteria bacterium RBG_16_60_9]
MCKKLLAAFLLLISATPLLAGELEERAAYNKRFSTMFIEEQFGALDNTADEYRADGSRSSSGLWMLTHFYAGIGSVTNGVQDETYWKNIESKALRWAASNPNSPAAINAYARILIDHGWKFRGGAWANQVPKENWKPFYEHLAKAKEYLLQNKRVASVDPRWFENMLTIARGEGWDRKLFDALAAEAVSKHPYFYQMYFSAIDYLVPKWNGSKEEIETFANFAVEQTTAKEGMGMYARIYWYASQTYYNVDLFESDVDWDKMKRGIDDVLARYPDAWNINNFAFFACLSGDKQKTTELIGKITGPPIARAWNGSEYHYYERCKAWTQSSRRLFRTDTQLTGQLVGQWQKVRLLENEGKMYLQNISIKSDGTIEATESQYDIKNREPIQFTWRGNWGVTDGMFWYITSASDQPQTVPVGKRLDATMVSASRDEWVMIDPVTRQKFRARRVTTDKETSATRR